MSKLDDWEAKQAAEAQELGADMFVVMREGYALGHDVRNLQRKAATFYKRARMYMRVNTWEGVL